MLIVCEFLENSWKEDLCSRGLEWQYIYAYFLNHMIELLGNVCVLRHMINDLQNSYCVIPATIFLAF
jgi:hypothetical protein